MLPSNEMSAIPSPNRGLLPRKKLRVKLSEKKNSWNVNLKIAFPFQRLVIWGAFQY